MQHQRTHISEKFGKGSKRGKVFFQKSSLIVHHQEDTLLNVTRLSQER